MVFLSILSLVGSWLWRKRCEKVSTPWPYWLAFWLENPFMIFFCNKYKLASHLSQLKNTGNVVDIGCGAGRIAIPLASLLEEKNRKIIAIDMQEKMLKRARSYASKENIFSIDFYNLNLEKDFKRLESIAGDVFLVYLVTVLGEIPNKDKLFIKFFRLLSNDGVLSITETIPDPCYQSSSKVIQLAVKAGFQLYSLKKGVFTYTADFIKPSNHAFIKTP